MSVLMVWMASASDSINSGVTQACGDAAGGACNQVTLAVTFGRIANTLTILVGAVSVIMIIVGGLRYATSNGDSKNVTAAKDTIFYAVIGVVVAIVAFAIVQFVTATIGNTPSSGAPSAPSASKSPSPKKTP